MNAGLLYLLRKQPVGWLRRLRRRARGPRGVWVVLGVVFLAIFLIGPQVVLAITEGRDGPTSTEGLRRFGPPVLMLMALLSMSSGAGLYFRPAEIGFLFPAPIGRRELLLYNVLGRLNVAFLSALWMAIFTLRFAPLWYGGIVGIFFGLAFVQLAAQLASLGLSTISMRMAQRARRFGLLALAVLLVLGILAARHNLPDAGVPDASVLDAMRALADSTVVAVLCAPARVLVETFASETSVSFLGWGAGGLGVLAAMFGLIALLDISYTESALRVSRQVQERLQRMRSGGSARISRSATRRRLTLPRLAWLGGAGPIAWQKGLAALRNSRRLLWTMAFMIGLPLVMVFVMGAESGAESTGMVVWIAIFMTVMMNQNIALDFRRDIDRMPYLKSLPLRPARVALGQILPGTILFTFMHAVIIVVVWFATGVSMQWMPAALLALFPFNWVSVALDNLLFLLLPHRAAPQEAGQVQFVGRVMIVMFAKVFALMFACGAAALAGWLGWLATGESVFAAGLAAALVLACVGGFLTWLTGNAFRGFDVTRDVPG